MLLKETLETTACSERSDDDTPGIAPDLDRADDAQFLHVYDGHVIGCAVGREQKLLVGREAELPDALTDQQITLHLQCCRVDDRDSICRSERDECALPVPGDSYADRLNRILIDARDLETDLADDLARAGIDDGHRSEEHPSELQT